MLVEHCDNCGSRIEKGKVVPVEIGIGSLGEKEKRFSYRICGDCWATKTEYGGIDCQTLMDNHKYWLDVYGGKDDKPAPVKEGEAPSTSHTRAFDMQAVYRRFERLEGRIRGGMEKLNELQSRIEKLESQPPPEEFVGDRCRCGASLIRPSNDPKTWYCPLCGQHSTKCQCPKVS